jgi:hypothetical protein
VKDPLGPEPVAVVPEVPVPRPVSRELGALRPLDWSVKDEEPLLSEPVFEVLDFALFEEDEPAPDEPAGEEALLSEPISEELDVALFEEDELADSTPSDFMVSESMLPVAFILLAL